MIDLQWCVRTILVVSVAALVTGVFSTSGRVQESPAQSDLLGDPLPEHALLRLGTNRFCPPSSYELMLSADDRIVVSFGGGLRAWDADSGKLVWSDATRIPTGAGAAAASYGCRRLCRMPISNKLVTASLPGAIELWDFKTGESSSIQTDLTENFKSIDVSPDELLFALGSEKMLLVCNESGEEVYRFENRPKNGIRAGGSEDRLTFGGEYSYARFSPDGKWLTLVNSEFPKSIQVLDAATGDVQRKIETKDNVVRIDFSGDSRHIATTQRDIAARTYDMETGNLVWQRIFSVPGMDERYTTDIEYSPKGSLIAVGTAIGEDQRIWLLDSKTGDSVGALEGHMSKPWSLQFTHDGQQLYSCGWDSVIRRWDMEKKKQIRIENSERASAVCAMAPNGKTAVFGDDSGKLHIVDASTGQKIKTLDQPGAGSSQVIYSQDSRLLATGGSNENDIHVYVFDLENYQVKHHWKWPKGRDVHSSVEALSFSRDSRRLGVAVFRQSAGYIFDLPSDKQIAEVDHRQVFGLSMSSDGHQFVSVGWDKKINIWDSETGELQKTITVADEKNADGDTRMYGVLFAPDGNSIATLGMDWTIRLWTLDLEPIDQFRMIAGVHFGSFQFSRNGLWLAVGHYNKKAAIYDVHAGEKVLAIDEHTDTIYNIDFGARDQTLLTGAGDGVCYLWDLKAAVLDGLLDFETLAQNLVGGSTKEAFAAYQCLAANPDKACPAIQTVMESILSNWVEPDEDDAAKPYNGIHRVAMFLAETEAPAAGELLDNLLTNAPGVRIKKEFFLATRQRKKFLERIGKSGE